MAALEPVTNDQVIAAIAALAKDRGDSFRIRVQRKPSAMQMPESVAVFDDASVEMVSNPEPWLPQVAGGGTFMLTTYHATEKSTPIGGVMTVSIGGSPRPVDASHIHSVVGRADWLGPRTVVFPNSPERQRHNGTNGITIPGVDSSPGSASRSSGSSEGGHAGDSRPPAPTRAIDFEVEQLRAKQRELDEAKHRMELDSIRRDNDSKLATLRADNERVLREIRDSKPAGPSVLEQTLPAAVGVLAELVKSSNETRLLMMRMQQESSDRQAQAQRDASNQQLQLMQTLFGKLAEKPAADPVMLELLKRKDDNPMAKVVGDMATVVGSTMNMMVQTMHTMQELQGPGETESSLVKLAREVGRVIIAVAPQAMKQVQLQVPPATPSAPPYVQTQQLPAQVQAQPPQAAQPAVPAQPATPPSAFEQILQAVKAHHNPTEVATVFLDHLNDPSIAPILQKANGNVLEAFGPYLSQWMESNVENVAYVRQLALEIQRIATTRGMIPAAAPAPAAPAQTNGAAQPQQAQPPQAAQPVQATELPAEMLEGGEDDGEDEPEPEA